MADMKNSVADRMNAQVSCAALFIQSHLGFDFEGDWIHIDMASPVYSVSMRSRNRGSSGRRDFRIPRVSQFYLIKGYIILYERTYFQGERATGYGIALLNSLFADYSTNSCVKSLSPFVADENDKKRIRTD